MIQGVFAQNHSNLLQNVIKHSVFRLFHSKVREIRSNPSCLPSDGRVTNILLPLIKNYMNGSVLCLKQALVLSAGACPD